MYRCIVYRCMFPCIQHFHHHIHSTLSDIYVRRMSQASNTAGVVGKFGSTSFISVSTSRGPKDPRLPPKFPRPKFFKSRNLKDVENVIEEEEEAEAEQEEKHEGSIISANNESTYNILRFINIFRINTSLKPSLSCLFFLIISELRGIVSRFNRSNKKC